MKNSLFLSLILVGLLSAHELFGVMHLFIKSQFTGNITVTTTRCGFIVDAPIKSGYTYRADGCKQGNDYLEEIVIYNKDGGQLDRQYVTDKKLSGDVIIKIDSDGKITEIADLKNSSAREKLKDSQWDQTWDELPDAQLKQTAAKLRLQN